MAESSVTPANLEKAFNEKKITPNIIKVAPTKLFSVNFNVTIKFRCSLYHTDNFFLKNEVNLIIHPLDFIPEW